MTTGQGRSWRPEKTRRARESRRMQIIAVCVFLTALVSVVAWLVIGSGVPVLHFVFVTADSFESDATGITPLPSGSAEFNRARLQALAQRYHDANPERIGAPGDASSLTDFAAGLPQPSDESLVIYCSTEAWCAPDENTTDRTLVVFLCHFQRQPAFLVGVFLGSKTGQFAGKFREQGGVTGIKTGIGQFFL